MCQDLMTPQTSKLMTLQTPNSSNTPKTDEEQKPVKGIFRTDKNQVTPNFLFGVCLR